MKILTIDSTLNKLYVALGVDGFFESKIIKSDTDKYHSAYIASAVVELLKKHELISQNLDAIAVNIGPGSFTGIRVGITFARIIAQAHDLKTVRVSSLEILAKLNSTEQDTLVLMDARKGKAYAAIYGVETLEPCAVPLDEALNLAKSGKYFAVSDKNMTNFLRENSFDSLNYEDSDADLGRYLLEIAKEKLKTDEDFNWAKLKPLYIQPPPITMPKK